mgnify:CR=1 FL=1
MKLLDVLNELLINPVDMDALRSWGEHIVEEVDYFPYTVFLTKKDHSNVYQVGFTSNGEVCSSSSSQQKKTSCTPVDVAIRSKQKIVEKVMEWNQTYGKLIIGSYNGKKITQ